MSLSSGLFSSSLFALHPVPDKRPPLGILSLPSFSLLSQTKRGRRWWLRRDEMKTLPDYLTTWLPDYLTEVVLRGKREEQKGDFTYLQITETNFLCSLFTSCLPSCLLHSPFSFLIVADSFSILPSYDSSRWCWWWRRKVSLPFWSFFSFPLPGSVLPVSSLHLSSFHPSSRERGEREERG